ncbi:hypothetical protein FSP39_006993 [Pinctada imbricata]|uniref:PLD phosphodiesterase domain-containing protein n=1 Tax=Pinctada imbricata TaxID=66713 RepID=A0AA88Y2H8_PINIB|nr:hypothetical protein FSP39_006993 [Pinctada imbricata]
MNSDKEYIVKDPDSVFGTQRPKTVSCRAVILIILVTCFVICIAVGLTTYFVFFNKSDNGSDSSSPQRQLMGPSCSDPCVLTLVESIPENLTYTPGSPSHPSTYEGLMDLMSIAQNTIEIASYYWTLNGSDIPYSDASSWQVINLYIAQNTIEIASYYWSLNGSDIPYSDASSWQGESILQTLGDAGNKRKLKIRIAQNEPDSRNKDPRVLTKIRLMGGGILHTKMWLIDRTHFYVGSANLDWRSLTQVKELGAVLYNCSCMAKDMGKLFDTYWYLGTPEAVVPPSWPSDYDTSINGNTSMQIKFNGTDALTYLSSSPPPFCAKGRTIDVDAIVNIINDADKFVYIAVMDYFPSTQFIKPRRYWPVIDDAIRRAAFDRGVNVSLLISYWKHTWQDMQKYLKSLAEMRFHSYYKNDVSININVKMFEVPAFTEAQKKIPYSRVNHNKYMVTDKVAYIGTSNWSGDYFIDTGGIGLIVNQTSPTPGTVDGMVRKQVEDIFLRDWYSNYSTYIWDFPFKYNIHEEL